jgi:hypothetical protein
MRHPTLYRIISLVSCSPSMSTIRLLRNSDVSRAEGEKPEVVTNNPFDALCRSKLPKKSRIAPAPTLLPVANAALSR